MMIRQLKSDIRMLEWTDLAELVSIGGFICSAFVLSIVWSGNLPS